MAKCPQCRKTLSDESLHGKRCIECGFDLDEDGSVDQTIDSGDSSEFEKLADELSRFASAGTVDSTSLPEGVSIPPEGAAGDAADDGDSDADFTLKEEAEDGEPTYSQTIDSSNMPDAFELPDGDVSDNDDSDDGDSSVDDEASIEDEPYTQTIDSSDLPDDFEMPGGSDSGKGGSDSGDFSVDDDVLIDDGTGTVSGSGVNQTVDSSFDELPVNLGDEGPSGMQTVDSVDLPEENRIAGGTVHAHNQTVDAGQDGDFDASVPPGGVTLNERNPRATFDSASMPLDGESKDGTVHARELNQTFQSNVIDEDEATRMNDIWGGAANENSSPQMTIRGNEPSSEPPRSSLVIQKRAIVDAKGTDTKADYDILSKLGQGGMGVVYAARQASIDRTVALKMLKPEGAADANQRNKFLSEAVITGELEHPNIVPIYDLGHNDENALFYAMKRIQGTPWDDVIKQKSLAENLEIFMKTCDAVAFGHSRGIIHRDLKPENTMLGDYGEVLVMDWGLALPFGRHAKSRTVKTQAGMGGTPTYMAPEMATGPFNKMGPASDIYLLGAILFEIVAGRPPHPGKDVMKCLLAAAKNQIVKTDVTGELIDIAYQAMATKTKDRYRSVQELQEAIRQYQEHSESIAMATRASEEFAEANESDEYEGYSRAVFGYREAYTLWDGNHKAKRGASRAKLAYAGSAHRKGDLDLALSLVDPEDETHQGIQEEILAAQREREAKTHRLRRAKRAVTALIAVVLLGGSVGLVAINYQRSQAVEQRDLANVARNDAENSERDAKAARNEAEGEKKKADESAVEARTAEGVAKLAKDAAIKSKLDAEASQQAAEASQLVAEKSQAAAEESQEAAEKSERFARYEEYIALIGLAAAKIEENAFDTARELLLRSDPNLRNWEWGRLMHLCHQNVEDFDAHAKINATAFSPDGTRFVTGSWKGFAHVWQRGREEPVIAIKHDGLLVNAVAWSPTENLIATGSNSPSGFLRISDATNGKTIRVFKGHQKPVQSVKFSPDGKYLLSTSLDNTARLWDVKTGQEARETPFEGHSWFVWDAAFSPDGNQIVTASHDGTAIVWPVNEPYDPAKLRTFAGHSGAVYAVAYSPDGKYVASGGYDKQVLLWEPGKVQPFKYEEMLDGQSVAADFKLLGKHAASVRSVVFSPDGKMVISAAHDNTIKLWHVETGRLLQTMRGHGSLVRACAISPDGKWVLSGGYDERAKLWSIEGYEEVRVLHGHVLKGHSDAVMSAVFSQKGDKILTASRDRSARAYSTQDGRELASYIEGHSFLASTSQFFDDGLLLMTAAGDNTVRVWDVTTGVERLKLNGTGIAAAAAVSANGRWILSGSPGDQQAKLWDAKTGAKIGDLNGHDAEVTAVAFSPDDRFLFTGDSNGRGVLWDRSTQEQLLVLRWHTSGITAAAFLADGTRLLTASDDKTVCTWDVSRLGEDVSSVLPLEDLVLKHPNTVWSLDVSRDGKTALTSCQDGGMRLWDLATASVVREIKFKVGGINSARLKPDGKSAVSVHTEPGAESIRQWKMPEGREIKSRASDGTVGPLLDFKIEGGLVWTAEYTPDGNALLTVGGNEARLWDLGEEENRKRELMRFSPNGAVATASFSPNGKRVVTASWDMSARIWDAETSKDLLKLSGHSSFVNSAVFSPDGTSVLTSSDDMTAIVWDAQTGQARLTLSPHGDRVRDAAFSADGTLIVTACEDRIARIWDAQTGMLLKILPGHEYGVTSADFSRDMKYVITGSDDKTARVWEIESDKFVTLTSHTAAVTSVAFSPDGLRVLTASEDFTAKLWDPKTGREILNLKGHSQEVTSVSFSAEDGRYALTSSRDGTAIMWLTVAWKEALQAE
jgi:WD40 repeat protein